MAVYNASQALESDDAHNGNSTYQNGGLSRWPENFVVMGDAVCALNPLYGQGMTLCTLGALALDERLRQSAGRMTGLARCFQKQLAQLCQPPWMMAIGEDFRYPGTEGSRPGLSTRLMHWYTDQLYLLLPEHPQLIQHFAQVVNMLASPISLMRPTILLRVVQAWGYRPEGTDITHPKPNGSHP
jgi:hypothetical protein